MPHLVVTGHAARGIARCLRFLSRHDNDAVNRAAQAIDGRFTVLRTHPTIGRPALRRPGRRELVIPFGNSGYLALYRYESPRTRFISWRFDIREKPGIDETSESRLRPAK